MRITTFLVNSRVMLCSCIKHLHHAKRCVLVSRPDDEDRVAMRQVTPELHYLGFPPRGHRYCSPILPLLPTREARPCLLQEPQEEGLVLLPVRQYLSQPRAGHLKLFPDVLPFLAHRCYLRSDGLGRSCRVRQGFLQCRCRFAQGRQLSGRGGRTSLSFAPHAGHPMDGELLVQSIDFHDPRPNRSPLLLGRAQRLLHALFEGPRPLALYRLLDPGLALGVRCLRFPGRWHWFPPTG